VGVGSAVGLGTSSVAMSLIKTIPLGERWQMRVGMEATNLFNHENFVPPNMQVGSGGFGTISALQTAEGAGLHIFEITARVNF
jgi:hypothetical protein